MIEKFLAPYRFKADFCRDMQISQQFLFQIEKGKRRISPKLAFRISEKFGVPLEELMREILYPRSDD